MNKQNYSGKTKVCGTCKYFVANRDLSLNQQYVIAEPDIIGKCFFSKYKGLKRKVGDRNPSCWIKWDLLNEDKKSEALQNLEQLIAEIKTSDDETRDF